VNVTYGLTPGAHVNANIANGDKRSEMLMC